MVVALAAAIGWRLLEGGINFDGILDSKRKGPSDYELSGARIQLLAATIFIAGYVLLSLDEMIEARKLTIDTEITGFLLGGSNGLYLFHKFRGHHPGEG